MDERYLEIKSHYYRSAEVEGEDYKYLSLSNEDIEYLFSLIENKINEQ